MIRGGPNSVWKINAPAKVNLRLEVLGKRNDGYHELSSLLLPLGLQDSISFIPVAAQDNTEPGYISLTVNTPPLLATDALGEMPPMKQNLAHRAAMLLQLRAGITDGAKMHLVKRIPSQAGLGGGSSDAAAVLMVANAAWKINWPKEKLMKLAAELGSDIPFFIAQSAAMFSGRGEKVTPLKHASQLHLVLAKPNEGLSTAKVFGKLNANKIEEIAPAPVSTGMQSLAEALKCGMLGTVILNMKNDLEFVAQQACSSLGTILHAFKKQGILGCQMTGSGTTVFGICSNAIQARRVAAALRVQRLGWILTTTAC